MKPQFSGKYNNHTIYKGKKKSHSFVRISFRHDCIEIRRDNSLNISANVRPPVKHFALFIFIIFEIFFLMRVIIGILLMRVTCKKCELIGYIFSLRRDFFFLSSEQIKIKIYFNL